MAGGGQGQVYPLTGRLRREGGTAGPQGTGMSAQEGLALVRSRGDKQENCKHKCAGEAGETQAQTRGAGTPHSSFPRGARRHVCAQTAETVSPRAAATAEQSLKN